MRHAHRSLAFALTIALASGRARAAVDSELVKQGVAAYEALDYARAVGLLERALRETLTGEESVVAWRTLGFCHLAFGREDDARRDFVNLLHVDGTYEFDRTVSPRARALFEEARAALAVERGTTRPPPERSWEPVALQPALDPPSPVEGQPLALHVAYPGGVASRLEVFYRPHGQPRYARAATPVALDGNGALTVPQIGRFGSRRWGRSASRSSSRCASRSGRSGARRGSGVRWAAARRRWR
jgi:hypothetical protein